MTGTLTAYYKDEFIVFKKYDSMPEIERIKQQWRKLYGKGYDKLTIVDKPDPPKEKKVKTFDDDGEYVAPDKINSKKTKKVFMPKIHKAVKPSPKTYYSDRH